MTRCALRVDSLQLELQLEESARSSLLQLIAACCSLNTALQLDCSLIAAWGPSMLCAALQLGLPSGVRAKVSGRCLAAASDGLPP